jgi:mono/diheme cytochrome c family protein
MKNRIRLTATGMMVAFMVTTAFAQNTGADTYKAKCTMCHGADGLANTPAGKAMKVPPFGPKLSNADLIAITKNGKGKMPAYASKLADGQIEQVVTYIRTLQKK